MRSTILYVLMTAMLASTSVSGGSAQTQRLAEPLYGHENPIRSSVPVVKEPFRSAYTERRWVGLRSKGIDHCPKVTGWVSETLLDQVLRKAGEDECARVQAPDERAEISYLKARLANRILLHKMGLERYCIYTPDGGPWQDFQQPAGLDKARQDRLALSITSAGGVPEDLLAKKIWPALAHHFRDQTGQEASSPESPLLLPGPSNVRLTFIDSQPDGEKTFSKPLEQDSQHGFTLVRLAQDMLCPSPGPCPVTIATRRALSYRDFDPQAQLPPNPVQDGQSGHVGLVSDLASAIFAEVLRWQQVEPEKKLIINLSLGWDGEGFKDLDAYSASQLEPSVRAVYNALRFARKSGALVIAAAGNQRGNKNTRWPLLPAAWELRRPNWFRWSFFGRPVYAVGGADSQGLTLPNSRPGGRPRRVAYADHSVTFAAAADEPTAIYTGTSVSTAVASSIAAAVWHLRPELRPAQVMRLLFRSGNDLPARADFYAWKRPGLIAKLVGARHARRLSLCPAVEKACGTDGSRCSALASVPKCPQWAAKTPKLWEPIQELPPGEVHVASTISGTSASEEFIDVASQRWVMPQPENDPCPGCTLVQKPPPSSATTSTDDPEYFYDLEMAVGSTWANANPGFTMQSATLEIVRFVNGSPTDTMTYTIPSPALGQIYTVLKLGDGKSFLDCTAQITFVVKKADGTVATILNPVVISSSTS